MDHNQNQDNQSDTKKKSEVEHEQHSSDYAPYPKLDPIDINPPPPSPPPPPPPPTTKNQENWSTVVMGSQSEQPDPSANKPASASPKSVSWSSELTREVPSSTTTAENYATTMPIESNPYVSSSRPPPSSVKNTVDSVRNVLGKWGKKVGETTKKAEDLAGNVWQHLKTSPSLADAAMGRIAQGTKVLAEGGYEKIFRQTFETVPEEQLQKSYACYLSTSAGPVMGILYLSTAKLAFSSDSPLSYKVGDQTEWSYYKVVIPLHQLKAVNPSASKVNSAEKYIQVISVDNHEFWFMGFVNYVGAVKSLQEVLQAQNLQSV